MSGCYDLIGIEQERLEPWKIIIADDEEDIHNTTRLILKNYSFNGQELHFYSAFSGKETKELIKKHPDTAIILVDVIMETEDAGLEVVRYIRKELNNNIIQIILRTGQTGQAPEQQIVEEYEINGYKSKTEMTSQKMLTLITSSLRAYCLAYSYNEINAQLKQELIERKLTEEALRESEAKWRSLVKNAPEKITTLDCDGTILYANHSSLNTPMEDVIGSSIHSYLSPAEQKTVKALLKLVFETGEPQKYESVRENPEGGSVWYENSIAPISSDDQIVAAILLAMNITERKRAEESLNIYKHIVSSSSDHMAFIDRNYTLLAVNDAFVKALNKEKDEIIGYSIQEAFGKKEFENVFKNYCDRCLAGEEILFEKWYDYHVTGRRYMVITMYPHIAKSDSITGVVINLRDITERVHFEKAMVDIGENERRKIGIELHDGLSHYLLGIAIKARLLSENLEEKSLRDREDAIEIENLINKAIKETRNLARGLFPVNLEEGGLPGLIEDVKRGIEKNHRLDCNAEIDSSVEIPDIMITTQLYYIVQEAVANAVKHSKARSIDIKLVGENGHNLLMIKDDGVGLPEKIKEKKGMGLNIMTYRARMIGASMDIGRGKEGGTEIVCKFRIHENV
ncbi:MAG: PAS domain S-box protein [bacterium]|nr:PAS domain S-box protein [bacterium]